MVLISLGVSFGGRPPVRPRARAADGSFPDEVALELGKGGEDVKDEPAGRGDGFDLLGNGLEVDLALFELGDEADQVGQIPPEPVQTPHDEGVAFAKALETRFELRVPDVLPGGLLFVDLPAFARLSASCCRSRVWSSVETRA